MSRQEDKIYNTCLVLNPSGGIALDSSLTGFRSVRAPTALS